MTNPRDIKYSSELFADWNDAVYRRTLAATHNMSFAMLRGVLIELREQLDLTAIATVGNNLPTLIRGIFYQDFDPARERQPAADAEAFEATVAERLLPHIHATEGLARDVFAVMRDKIEPHEAVAIRDVLPAALLLLWDS